MNAILRPTMKRIIVAAAAIAVFAVLCWDSGLRMGEAHPTVRRCQSDPGRFAGRDIWIIPGRISSPDPEGFDVKHATGVARVRSTLNPPADEYVFLRGVFKEDGTIQATAVHVESRFLFKRRGIILISLITLFFFAILFFRAFEWRAGGLQVRQHRSAVPPQQPVSPAGSSHHSAEAPQKPHDKN